MDVLGKEGERAAEAVQNLSQRLEDLESHLNAVDSAVQDNSETTREMASQNRQRLTEVEQLMLELTEIQKNNVRSIDEEDGHGTRLDRKVEAINEKLRRTREDQDRLEERMDELDRDVNTIVSSLKRKIFEIEDELTAEADLNRAKIKSRVTESRFEQEVERLEDEISRLKTGIRAVASEMDDDRIRVE